jgi:rod shape-determining protein MreD
VTGALRFLAGLALAALAQAAGARLLPGFAGAFDLFLVATVVAARHGRLERALVAGSLAGWAADALSGAPFGLFGFSDAAVGYLTAVAAHRLVFERPGSLLALFAGAGAAHGLLLSGLGLLVVGAPVPGPGALVLRVLTTALVGPLWIELAEAGERRLRRLFRRPARGLRPPGTLS